MTKKIVSSVMCGVYISIGATAFLVCENSVAGAFLFMAGILLVSAFFGMLVTRVIALLPFKEYNVRDIIIALIGNAVGCVIYAVLLYFTRVNGRIAARTAEVTELRLTDSYISLFVLALFCGFLVACACLTPKVFPDNRAVSVSLSTVFVAVFVIIGFEHIVADSFFFALYSLNYGFKIELLAAFLIVAVGNIAGGLGTGYLERYRNGEK